MTGPGYIAVRILDYAMNQIKKIISEVPLYRNPSEFIVDAEREKIYVPQGAVLEQKLDIYYATNDQFRSNQAPRRN